MTYVAFAFFLILLCVLKRHIARKTDQAEKNELSFLSKKFENNDLVGFEYYLYSYELGSLKIKLLIAQRV